MGNYYLCYTFKLTLTFIHTLKVTTECTNALPLKLRKNQRDGATSAASAASPKVHSRHTLLDRKSTRPAWAGFKTAEEGRTKIM